MGLRAGCAGGAGQHCRRGVGCGRAQTGCAHLYRGRGPDQRGADLPQRRPACLSRTRSRSPEFFAGFFKRIRPQYARGAHAHARAGTRTAESDLSEVWHSPVSGGPWTRGPRACACVCRGARLRSSRAPRVLPPGCGYGSSGGGLTRNPEWPLQESPGWKPDALRSAGVAPKNSLLWPQFCGGAPPGPGKPAPSPSSRPEKAQIELAWAAPKPSPPTGWPLPLISPALAVLAAPPSRIAVANTVAAAVRNRMFPPEDDADGAETVLETGRSCRKVWNAPT